MSLLLITLGVLILFSFWNGFTDAANAISTIIGTRVLSPIRAVALAALGNMLGGLFGIAVATTIGRGIIDSNIISGELVLAAITGGMIWDVITWFFGLPCSESHVLIGGLVGAGIASAGLSVVNYDGIINKVLIPMIFSPLLAIVIAFLITGLVIWAFKKHNQRKINKHFKGLQIVSSFFLSIMHGSNDGQKVAGIMTAVLLSYGVIATFEVPLWVILVSYSAMSIGTFFGGWRIVKTMAFRMTNLRPYQGFCAETGAALILGGTSQFGLPVSTTHVISGSIMGVGATSRLSAVRWKVARSIVWAWVLTMPAAALFAFIMFNVIRIFI
ncbi:MAG: inorganic phosphate transporter [Candidatus Altiarchaeota archaeon]|nr:inorganic phosphate transporter [Candidatus Altiarchaeota archaeon]